MSEETKVEVWQEGGEKALATFTIEGQGPVWLMGAAGSAGPYEVQQPRDDLLKIYLGPSLQFVSKVPEKKVTSAGKSD